MVIFLGLISSWVIIRSDHGHIAWPALWKVLPWCAVGVAAGIYFFKTLDARTLGKALGIFAMGYGAHSLRRTVSPAPDRPLPMRAVTPIAGSAGGLVGAMFGASAGILIVSGVPLLLR